MVAARNARLEKFIFMAPSVAAQVCVPQTLRCDISPLRWLRREGGESWRMLGVARRCAALELLGGNRVGSGAGAMRLAVQGGGDGVHHRGNAHRGLDLLG
jgi:hypothetical protein